MENLAPERTLTSSGSAGSPSSRPIDFSSFFSCLVTSSSSPLGQPLSMYARHASVVIVNPCGTGRPSTDVISARLAPLPPSRSFMLIGGLRCLWSNAKTYVMGREPRRRLSTVRFWRAESPNGRPNAPETIGLRPEAVLQDADEAV